MYKTVLQSTILLGSYKDIRLHIESELYSTETSDRDHQHTG